MKKTSFRKNNKGLTLVELLVVIAILAILAGVSAYSLNQVTSQRVSKFADRLDALLTECRVDALAGAKPLAFLKIYQEEDGSYYASLWENVESDFTGGREANRRQLGEGVSCDVLVNGTLYHIGRIEGEAGEGNALYLGFDRTTGAFVSLGKYAKNSWIGETGGKYAEKIVITGGSASRSIMMIAETGYFDIE